MSLSTEAVIALVTLLVMCLCIPGLWSFIRRRRLLQQAKDAVVTLFRNNESPPPILPLHTRPGIVDEYSSHPPQRRFGARFGAGGSVFIRQTSEIQVYEMYTAPPWSEIITSMPEGG